tara:strand:- start:2037 stop:3413 length:1377 start_codon:yes stop_codon:yes gene_type:complete
VDPDRYLPFNPKTDGINKFMNLQIIGAGPAGLAIGYYAKKKKIPLQIFESSDSVGGNCKTLNFGNYKFDTGAHRFHNKDSEATTLVKSLLKEELLKVNAPSKIYWQNKMINFPLEIPNLISNLDKPILFKVIVENLVKPFSFYNSTENFRDLAFKRYGKTLAELFLINYTEKLWGQEAHLLKNDIAGNRLKGLNITSIIKSIFGINKENEEHFDGTFYYPKNGFGTIFEAMRNYIGKDNIKLRSKVLEIHHQGNFISEILLEDNKSFSTSNLVSTLPLSLLIKSLRPLPKKNILDAVNKIKFRFLRLGIILLDMEYFSKNASIYFADKNIPFTRIYEPKNRSEMMAPKNSTCIVVEVPCEPNDSLYNCNQDEFIDMIKYTLVKNNLVSEKKIINSTSMKVPYAYPLLDKETKISIRKAHDFIQQFDNLFIIGRSAEFKYLHTHDLIKEAKHKVSTFFT